MVDRSKNVAASVKDQLLNIARVQGRGFDILLVRFALERLLSPSVQVAPPQQLHPEEGNARHAVAGS